MQKVYYMVISTKEKIDNDKTNVWNVLLID